MVSEKPIVPIDVVYGESLPNSAGFFSEILALESFGLPIQILEAACGADLRMDNHGFQIF